MMKTKTLVTTVALAGALLAGASSAKANAFLQMISAGNQINTTSATDSGMLAGNVGGWKVVTETGTTAAGPVVDVDISGGTKNTTAPLWVVFSTSGLIGSTGNFSLATTVGNPDTTVLGWLYNGSSLYTSSSAATPPAIGVLPFFTQTAGPTTTTYGNVVGLDYFTEVLEIIPPRAGTDALSIDSRFVLPDGGSTVAMLGSLLMGIAGLRSKFGKRA